jgi:hypothetical protein
MDNAPVVVDSIADVGGDPIAPTDDSLMVYMGEKVSSLRQLMKRYNFHDNLALQGAGGAYVAHKWRILNFPELRGAVLAGKTTDVDGFKFNYTHMTWMNYVSPCYAGWRGGIRRKYEFWGIDNRAGMDIARESRSISADDQTYENAEWSQLNNSQMAFQQKAIQNAGRGGAYQTACATNGIAEVELPFYSEYRFGHTHKTGAANTLTRKPDGLCHTVFVHAQGLSGNESIGNVRTSVAAGEDFSLFWFTNVPYVYNYTDVPPSILPNTFAKHEMDLS